MIAELSAGHAFRSSLNDESPGLVHVFTMAQSLGDSLNLETELPQIDFSGDIARLQLAPGDLLFRARGITTQAIFVESVQQPCIFAAPLVRIRVSNPQELDARYLHWVLNAPQLQRDINAEARGSMIRMVSIQSLRSLQIPMPPISVQQEIAEVARLLREERALSESLMEKNKIYAEKVLWAKAQEVQ
ncbi:MAG: restriction endonuclease subunit S [Pseudomonadota bacterium]